MERIILKNIHPAAYNPRILSKRASQELKESISILGIVKPILINAENNTIIAGHQRSKTLIALGYNEAPGYYLKGLNESDEIRFNQLHNMCEVEVNVDAPKLHINDTLTIGINRISYEKIYVKDKGKLFTFVNAIGKLITKFGEFAAPVVTENGEVVTSSVYAYAAKMLGRDIDVFVIPEGNKNLAIQYFSKQYGEFSYEHLPKKTYIQSLAQMKRLRHNDDIHKDNKSTLYEKMVLPYLKTQIRNKNLRILDFGAGQYDYAKKLKREGYDITMIDPYHRPNNTSSAIDYLGNQKTYQLICDDIQNKGLYDVVICDSVLNSVDSVKAEESVIKSVFGLCKQSGMVFISGRPFKAGNKQAKNASRYYADSLVHYFDKNGFTGMYRNGEWFYQRFHKDYEVRRIGEYISNSPVIKIGNNSWQVMAIKDVEHSQEEIIDALMFEFSLPLPNGKKYDFADKIKNAYENRKMS